MSNNNLTNNFTSADGSNNFVGIDANGDGTIEQFVYDSNNDGFPEVRISSDTGFTTDPSSFEPSFGSTPARQPGNVFAPTTHDFEPGGAYANHGPSFGSTPQVPAPNFGDDVDIVDPGTEPETLIDAYAIDLGDGSVAVVDVNDGPALDSFDVDSDMSTLQYDYKIDELAEDISDISENIGIDLPDDYNSYALDIEGNGMVDTFAIDLGNDGTIDGIGFDLNEDGLFDVVGVDTDFDGIPDTFLSDIGNNGTVDDVFTIDEF